VREGEQHRVRDIVDASEGRLRPELARRELLFRPGDVYRTSRVERSIERLYATGLYQQVQVTPLPDSVTARVDFIMRVRERKQRWVDAGIGSGTSDRFRATAELGHRDLDTRALRGVLQGEFATYGTGRFRRAEVSGTVTEPWLLGVRVQGSVAGYLRRLDDRADPRFVQRLRERGVEFAVSREIGRYSRWTIAQRNALVDQSYEVLDDASGVADSLAASVVGRYRSNSLTGSVVRDYRDDRVSPREGSIQTLSAELAGGPLRGASSYRRAELVSSWYTPLPGGWNLAVRLSAGVAEPFGDAPDNFTPDTPDEDLARVPRQSRFFVGGVNSLRGYGENALPADGGLAMALANLELRVPVSGPLGLEFFLDAGNVWTRPEYIRVGDFVAPWRAGRGRPNDLRYAYGAGVRFVLPFGPLRVDFAWGEHPDFPGNGRKPVYQFAIGPSF
jgi:outer membrane protein insertion porin family